MGAEAGGGAAAGAGGGDGDGEGPGRGAGGAWEAEGVAAGGSAGVPGAADAAAVASGGDRSASALTEEEMSDTERSRLARRWSSVSSRSMSDSAMAPRDTVRSFMPFSRSRSLQKRGGGEGAWQGQEGHNEIRAEGEAEEVRRESGAVFAQKIVLMARGGIRTGTGAAGDGAADLPLMSLNTSWRDPVKPRRALSTAFCTRSSSSGDSLFIGSPFPCGE